MISIRIPNNNIEERSYAVSSVFEIIGVNYNLLIDSDITNYILEVEDCELIICDLFFSTHKEQRSYLSIDNIPQKVSYVRNNFIIESDLPVIYGTDELLLSKKRIKCGIDVFASVFFMLTRWEETVLNKKDSHGRFPASYSLALKAGFIERPVVNEYCEMLWNMLKFLGCQDKRNNEGFSIRFTHDIDVFRKSSLKEMMKSIIRFKSIKNVIDTFIGFISFKYDVYNLYDYFMDKSERCNTKSHFYFMSDNTNHFLQSKKFHKTIRRICGRGHYIGFHPGYNTYRDCEKWGEQLHKLESVSKMKIREGRQHVLQIVLPETIRIWEKYGMECDSTLCYAEKSGFRCGTGNSFFLFDVLGSKQLSLKEMPLIIMDVTLKRYECLPLVEAKMKIKTLIETSRKYDMPITLLFHNSNFYGKEWQGWMQLYDEIC